MSAGCGISFNFDRDNDADLCEFGTKANAVEEKR